MQKQRGNLGRTLGILLVLVLLMLLSFPAMQQSRDCGLSEAEILANLKTFGAEEYQQIQEVSDTVFLRVFVDSGLFFTSSKTAHPLNKHASTSSERDTLFSPTYREGFWKLIYRTIYRFQVLWHWSSIIFPILFAAVFDGWQMRKLKKYTFTHSDPLVFHLIRKLGVSALFCFVVLCFLPLYFKELAWILSAFFLSLLFWKMAESFQTSA